MQFYNLGLILFVVSCISCQSNETTQTTLLTTLVSSTTTNLPRLNTTISQSKSTSKTTTTVGPTMTTSTHDKCSITGQNATCKACLSENCFFCNTDQTCRSLKFDTIFPAGCKPSDARWLNCSVNFEALLIAVGAIGFVIVLLIFCCVCYCCNATCRSISDSNFRRVESKIRKQGEQRRAKNEERRQERQAKNDAIRVKYGLKPSTYSELNNE